MNCGIFDQLLKNNSKLFLTFASYICILQKILLITDQIN